MVSMVSMANVMQADDAAAAGVNLSGGGGEWRWWRVASGGQWAVGSGQRAVGSGQRAVGSE